MEDFIYAVNVIKKEKIDKMRNQRVIKKNENK